MGQLIHKTGNVLDSPALIVAHGCNCRGGYGSGVAGAIAKLYPKAREAYLIRFKYIGWELGEIQPVQVKSDKTIVNMTTQDTYGKTGVHVNYPAVKQCFENLVDYAEANGVKLIAIPKVGAGLAGGDWNRIEQIIQSCIRDRDIVIDCYTLE